MFGKIFASIYEGTLHGQWEAIVTMQQLIVLCDSEGVVDMTPQAISARTSIPAEIIQKGLEILMQPDPDSRSPAEGGRRLVPLEPGRAWGWRLVNHEYYRNLASREDKRRKDRDRVAAKRRKSRVSQPVADSREPSQKSPIQKQDTNTSLGGRSRNRRDELFEALAEACAWPLDELTNDARGRLNAAAKQLRELKATSDQVRERATRYRKRYPELAITPQALTGHWAALASDGKSTPRHETEDECQQRERQERTGNAQSLFRLLHEPNSLRRHAGETADAWCDRVEAAWAEHTGQSKCQA